jgi:hypothetical protein
VLLNSFKLVLFTQVTTWFILSPLQLTVIRRNRQIPIEIVIKLFEDCGVYTGNHVVHIVTTVIDSNKKKYLDSY